MKPKNKAGKDCLAFFQLRLDDDTKLYGMRYDTNIKNADETHLSYHCYKVPARMPANPEGEVVKISRATRTAPRKLHGQKQRPLNLR